LGDGARLRVHNSGWFNNHDHNHNIDKHHQHDASRVHNNFFHDNFNDFNIYNNPSTRNDHNDFDNSCTNNHANDNNNVNDHHPSSNNDHNFCTIYTSSDDYD
jgi:hypothetical protein